MFGERGIGTHLPDSDPSYNLQHIRAASDNVSVLIRTSQTRLLLYADVSRMKMIFSSEDERSQIFILGVFEQSCNN